MVLSHALSCFLMRQMEYDADRYMVRLAGSKRFGKTWHRIAVLDVASQMALVHVVDGWHRDCLPDDLCPLIVDATEQISKKDRRRLEKQLGHVKARLFDTHPAYANRLASAQREQAPGVFHLDWPASKLFSAFPKLARAVTLHYYRCLFGRRVRREHLVPVATLLAAPEEPTAEPGDQRPGD